MLLISKSNCGLPSCNQRMGRKHLEDRDVSKGSKLHACPFTVLFAVVPPEAQPPRAFCSDRNSRRKIASIPTTGPVKGTGPQGENTLMHTRTISMLLGAVLSTGVVLAQAPDQTQPAAPAPQADNAGRHRAPNPDRMAKHLGKKLGLSGDQVAQIKPVLEDRAQQMQALHADTSLSQQDRRAKAQAIMQDSK